MYTVSELPILATDYHTQPILEMSVSKGKGQVPWSKLEKDQLNYIEAKYLPENLTLKEVHHLCQEEVDGILKHWTHRQAADEVPFTFRAPRPIQQNNRTVEESNADANMGLGKEGEENSQMAAEPREAAKVHAQQQTDNSVASNFGYLIGL